MQKTLTLKSQVRKERGSKLARRIRATGQIPAIIYGHGKDPESISLSLHDFSEMLHHGTRIFETTVGETAETLLVKALQYDFLGRNVIHADLVRVDLTETVRVFVAVETRGKAKTGIVDTLMAKLEVECVVTAIPDRITLVVREMNIGDTVKAGQIAVARRGDAGVGTRGAGADVPRCGRSQDDRRGRAGDPGGTGSHHGTRRRRRRRRRRTGQGQREREGVIRKSSGPVVIAAGRARTDPSGTDSDGAGGFESKRRERIVADRGGTGQSGGRICRDAA